MPAIPRAQLTQIVFHAFSDNGMSVHLISSPTSNPRIFQLNLNDRELNVFIYIWTLTFGGRPSLPNEYRIQMTGVSSPLGLNPEGNTILLGYEPNLQVFAGFDIMRHRSFTPGSPSVQIDIEVVRQALSEGLTLHRKSNDEVACGVRPDFLLPYIMQSENLHRYGKKSGDFQLLKRAGKGQAILESDLSGLSEPRRRTIYTVSCLSRNAKFRHLVLQAYDYRCAITGMQLRLVDAAHILPVGISGSTDEVCNGIAINPTYHRAYDTGLIYLDESYRFRLNRMKADELAEDGLDGGLREFEGYLDNEIILPSNPVLRPAVEYIREGNRVRGIG